MYITSLPPPPGLA